MKKVSVVQIFLLVAVSLLFVGSVSAREHWGMKSVRSARAIFDFRAATPKDAALKMDLIQQTYKSLVAMKKRTHFVVVFFGPSVKLASRNRAGFSPEDQKFLDKLAETVSAMSKEGVKFELCLVTAKRLNVDPASLLPEVKGVHNGWIALIDYQARGYSLVPVY